MLKRDIPRTETERQYKAYEVYRDLGYGRTYREVSRRITASPQTIANWAKWFKWKERIRLYSTAVEKREEAGELMAVDDPVVQKLLTAMQRVELLIASAFPTDPNGDMYSTIRITNAEELTKLLVEYRRFLESYNKAVREFKPDNPNLPKGTTNIKNLTVQFGSLPQEKRIELIESMIKDTSNGNDKRGDQQPAGRVQDADFTKVPEPGTED